jgi:hypothetical protein
MRAKEKGLPTLQDHFNTSTAACGLSIEAASILSSHLTR